jgi:two-component system, chemotaxis family, chemotaxis protein CheY
VSPFLNINFTGQQFGDEKMIKVLVVDDSTFTREIHKDIISTSGFEVVEAASGKEALAVFDQENPDLVMVDLLMPDMDGMEVVGKILERQSNAKIIICSSDKQKHRRADAKEAGVLEFFSKPVDGDKLVEFIKAHFKQ